MAEERLRIRTYSQVWKLERILYRIERVPLPFPVTVSQVGLFAGTAALMALLSRLEPVAAWPATLRFALLPGAVAWFLTRQSLDGKPPHLWLLTLAAYLAAPRRLGGLAPLPRPGRRRLRARVACRIWAEPTETGQDGQEA